MSRTSLILLEDTGTNLSVTGAQFRADGYFGYTDGNHTVSVHFNNFTGRIYIEASLASEPTESDWFPIELTTSTPYVQTINETSVQGYSFTSNIVFVRARMDRSYVTPIPSSSEEIANLGTISKVYLNH